MTLLSGALLAGSLAFAACGGDDEGGGGSSGAGGGGTGGAAGSDGAAATGGGGTGGQAGSDAGPTLAPVCVKTPTPAPWVGDTACPAPQPSATDALDEALTQAGVDRCKYGFSDTIMSIWKPIFADDQYQLPVFRPLHQGMLRLPAYAKETEAWLDAALDGEQAVSEVILHAAVRQGHAIDACAAIDGFGAAQQSATPLADALARLIETNGGSSNAGDLSAQTQGIPLDLQKALVPVLATLDWSAREFRDALGTQNVDELDWLAQVYGFVIPSATAFPVDEEHVAYLAKVDHQRIAAAAALLARAVEQAELAQFVGVAVPAVVVDTPLGAVVLGGVGNDTYAEDHAAGFAALVLDTGGDDTYQVPLAAGRRDLPVSIAIDLGGKDSYGYVVVPSPMDKPTRPPSDSAGRSASFANPGQTSSRIGRQGSGVSGIGLHWDLGSADDVYASLTLSQGSAALGVGVLYDAGGGDRYVTESTSQGSAIWGIGALIDRDGKDEYRTFFGAQGFGYVQGVGMLVEGGGDDVYFGDPGDPAIGGDPLYPSPQLPGEGNSSFVQGAGFGRRDDTTKLYMGGGAGLLYDRAGADHYTASVFAQGTGYWLGFGMLDDKAGDDVYEGLWYVQAASAHFALAYQVDYAGNDHYNLGFPIRATSIGVGHDFSGALHLDLGGDDQYVAPGLSLGCGNSQGAGGVINVGGIDDYGPKGGNTYGCASIGHGPPFDTVRDVRPTIGIFVDVTGGDVYAAPGGAPAAADGATWSHPVSIGVAGAPASEMSGGVDRDPGTVALP